MSEKKRRKCTHERAERRSKRGRRKSAYYEKDYYQVIDALIEVLDDYSDDWIRRGRFSTKVATHLGLLYTSRIDWLCKCIRAALLDMKASGLIVIAGKEVALLPRDESRRLQILNEALVHCVWAGDEKMMPVLVNKGADVNAFIRKRTALMRAAYYDHVGVVQTLLALGADPNIESESGDSALTIARKKRNER